MITKQTAQVFYSPAMGKRYFTLNAACRAEAREIIKNRYPTEDTEHEDGGRCCHPGWHWHEIERSEVLYRRLALKIKNAYRAIQRLSELYDPLVKLA